MVCYIGLFHAGNIKMRYFYKVAMFPLNSIFFQTKLLVSWGRATPYHVFKSASVLSGAHTQGLAGLPNGGPAWLAEGVSRFSRRLQGARCFLISTQESSHSSPHSSRGRDFRGPSHKQRRQNLSEVVVMSSFKRCPGGMEGEFPSSIPTEGHCPTESSVRHHFWPSAAWLCPHALRALWACPGLFLPRFSCHPMYSMALSPFCSHGVPFPFCESTRTDSYSGWHWNHSGGCLGWQPGSSTKGRKETFYEHGISSPWVRWSLCVCTKLPKFIKRYAKKWVNFTACKLCPNKAGKK